MFADLALPECLDETFLQALYDNITAVHDCSLIDKRLVTCVPFNVPLQTTVGGTATTNILEAVAVTADDRRLNTLNEQKLILFTTTESAVVTDGGGEQTGTLDNPRVQYSVSCGNSADLDPDQVLNAGCLHNLSLRCARDEPVVLSMRTEGELNGNVLSSSVTSRVCGAIICVNQIGTIAIEGYRKLPRVVPGCSYGREALYLAMQNCTALENRFIGTTQRPSCQSVTYNDTQPHALATATGSLTYFVIGTIRVCVESTAAIDRYISIAPVIGCQGEEAEPCPSRQFRIRQRDEGEPSVSACFEMRYVQCGKCSPGQTLYAGMRPVAGCDESAAVPTPGEVLITSVEQSYCVFKFETDIPNYGAISQTLSKCPSATEVGGLLDKIADLNAICIAQPEINITERNYPTPTIGLTPATLVLVTPQPFTPTPEQPEPPIKKWSVSADICSRLSGGAFSNVQRAVGHLKLELMCGTEVLYEDEVTWLARQRGGSDFDEYSDFTARCLKIPEQCIECPTDEPISVRVSGNYFQDGISYIPHSGTPLDLFFYARKAKAFCV